MADFDSRAEYVLLADVASGDYRSLAALSKTHPPACVTAAQSAGYLYADPHGLCRLTPAGQARLRHLNELSHQFKQQAQQPSNQHSKKHKRRISERAFQLLLALLTIALGFLADYLLSLLV